MRQKETSQPEGDGSKPTTNKKRHQRIQRRRRNGWVNLERTTEPDNQNTNKTISVQNDACHPQNRVVLGKHPATRGTQNMSNMPSNGIDGTHTHRMPRTCCKQDMANGKRHLAPRKPAMAKHLHGPHPWMRMHHHNKRGTATRKRKPKPDT